MQTPTVHPSVTQQMPAGRLSPLPPPYSPTVGTLPSQSSCKQPPIKKTRITAQMSIREVGTEYEQAASS